MSDIHDLEQRLQALEDAFAEQSGKIDRLLEKSDKALDLAIHAYKVDRYGYIWQYDCDTKEYVKSNMRVCTPEIADRALQSRHIADKAIEGRHLQDDVIDGTKIAPNTIPGRCIANESITGDHMDGEIIIPGKLATDSVLTRNIKDKNVTPDKISDDVYDVFVKPAVIILNRQIAALQQEDGKLHAKDADLQNQIDSFNEHGVSVSNEFGDDPHIGVSQKTLTQAFNEIWEKIEDITGEVIRGINMVVTPTFFVSEDGGTIHAAANTATTNGIFERIQFFLDGELIYEASNTPYVAFAHDLEIKPTYDYVIMCKAKIMGIEYTRQQVITRYNEFYIGAGSVYTDIIDSAHAKQLNGTMRHNYDVAFEDDQKLIIVMGTSLRDGFIRADLNGAEIQFTESSVTIDEKEYVVLVSDNWSAGDYNIDING